jgi:hypothetical protein
MLAQVKKNTVMTVTATNAKPRKPKRAKVKKAILLKVNLLLAKAILKKVTSKMPGVLTPTLANI